MIDGYFEDPVLFDLVSRSGPRNDGKCKQCIQSSYNNDYCQSFFGAGMTRRGFVAYIELVFGHKTSQELCERFQAKCCADLQHSKQCTQLWRQLERLVTSEDFLMSQLT